MQHNNFKKDLAMLTEAYGDIHGQSKVGPEDGEDLNPMRQFNYFLSQLSDMQKDLSLGVDTDSNIFQEIRHVAEQITTWCDDQQA